MTDRLDKHETISGSGRICPAFFAKLRLAPTRSRTTP